jgi:hypothetical protein
VDVIGASLQPGDPAARRGPAAEEGRPQERRRRLRPAAPQNAPRRAPDRRFHGPMSDRRGRAGRQRRRGRSRNVRVGAGSRPDKPTRCTGSRLRRGWCAAYSFRATG